MEKITPCLWFNFNADEAIDHYSKIFKDFKIISASRYAKGSPGPEGAIFVAMFTMNGQEFMALNAGPMFQFNEAVSFHVNCNGADDVDYYWDKLTADGGQESMCGWLKDKFGVSWQIVPKQLNELMSDKNPKKAQAVMQAMLQMRKIEVHKLREAYDAVA